MTSEKKHLDMQKICSSRQCGKKKNNKNNNNKKITTNRFIRIQKLEATVLEENKGDLKS